MDFRALKAYVPLSSHYCQSIVNLCSNGATLSFSSQTVLLCGRDNSDCLPYYDDAIIMMMRFI